MHTTTHPTCTHTGFAVHCGIFWRVNISVHWKDSVIETAFKIAYSLIRALTTEQGS